MPRLTTLLAEFDRGDAPPARRTLDAFDQFFARHNARVARDATAPKGA